MREASNSIQPLYMVTINHANPRINHRWNLIAYHMANHVLRALSSRSCRFRCQRQVYRCPPHHSHWKYTQLHHRIHIYLVHYAIARTDTFWHISLYNNSVANRTHYLRMAYHEVL